MLDNIEKSAYQRLQESEGRFDAIIENMPGLLYLKNLQNRYLLANRAFLDFFHYNGEEIFGKRDHELLPEPLATRFSQADYRVLQSGLILEQEEVLPYQKGEQIYHAIRFPVVTDDSGYFSVCAILTDMTEKFHNRQRILLDKEIQNLINELFEKTMDHSSLSLNSILDQALKKILALSWVKKGGQSFIFLTDHQTGQLTLTSQLSTTSSHNTCHHAPQRSCICQRTAETHQTTLGLIEEKIDNLSCTLLSPNNAVYSSPITDGKRMLGLMSISFERAPHIDLTIIHDFIELISSALASIIIRKQLDEALVKAKKTAEENYHKVQSSIQYASRIQRSILPEKSNFFTFCQDYFVIWEPRDIVGGDIYWCTPWGEGTLLILGDCTGHGVPGAFVTLLVSELLERAQMELRPGDVAGLMQKIHQLLQIRLGQHREEGESDDGMDLGICYRYAGKQELLYSGARFNLYQVSNRGVLNEIKGEKMGIGYRGIPYDQCYSLHRLPATGYYYYLTTDGLIDQVGEKVPRTFGKKRLKDLLVETHALPMPEQKNRIQQTLADYQGGQPRRDDISVIGFKI